MRWGRQVRLKAGKSDRAPLRFPHLSFIRLEPYPARYACHLPHADAGKMMFSFRCLPHGGRRYSHFPPLRRISTLSFILPVPYPPLRGTFLGGLTIRGKPAIADLRASPDLYCGEAATITLNLEPCTHHFPSSIKKEPAFAGSFCISTIYFLLKA